VCDIDPSKAAAAKDLLGATHTFTDYETMLDEGGCTAVVIGSPMPFHVAQSIAALDRNIDVLCEVTAGVTLDECKELVLSASRSDGIYMMAENINFDRTSVFVNSLVDAGVR
jgi:predicted dehydrogenase